MDKIFGFVVGISVGFVFFLFSSHRKRLERIEYILDSINKIAVMWALRNEKSKKEDPEPVKNKTSRIVWTDERRKNHSEAIKRAKERRKRRSDKVLLKFTE